MLAAWPTATPPVRTAILDALIARGQRIRPLLAAMRQGVIPMNALTALQRTQLLERSDSHLRPEVELALAKAIDPNKETTYARYARALTGPLNAKHGGLLFGQLYAPCHRVNQVGTVVGPDLKNAYANAKETMLRSILWPSEKIASSYEIYVVATNDNQIYSGILVSESANSVVLRQAGGIEHPFLRKDIRQFSPSMTSLMPEYGQALSPQDCADIIGWIKESLAVK